MRFVPIIAILMMFCGQGCSPQHEVSDEMLKTISDRLDRLENLDGEITATNGDIAQLEAQLSEIQAILDRDHANRQAALAELKKSMDEVKPIIQHRGDGTSIEEIKDAFDELKKRNDELKEEIASLRKQNAGE